MTHETFSLRRRSRIAAKSAISTGQVGQDVGQNRRFFPVIRPTEIRIVSFDGVLHARIELPPQTWRERLWLAIWRLLPARVVRWAVRLGRAR